MASTKEYLVYVREQLAALEGIAQRPMMGEFLLYCRGKLVGGVYDDRLLLKATPSALRLLAEAGLESPGAEETPRPEAALPSVIKKLPGPSAEGPGSFVF